jgi:capsular polysaccharide biosynthesis protein
VNTSPAVVAEHILEPASDIQWANPFEDAFYGDATVRTAALSETRLLELNDVFVTGSEAFIFSEAHTVLRLCASHDGQPARKIRHPLRFLALRIDDPVFLLGGRAPGNRGHFLVEHLPRMLLAQQKLGRDFPQQVLVTPGHASWQREYLQQFGFAQIKVIEASPGTTWCRRAWTLPNLSRTGVAELNPPDSYRELVSRLPHSDKKRPRMAIFLTRKDAPGRRLSNEDEIFSIAQRFIPDLQRISLAEMTIPQQAELAASAQVIIGAHSQAFRCVLFARDALIIQLTPGSRHHQNEYRFWSDNYSLLATLQNNRAVSLYANDSQRASQDYRYAGDRFESELASLLSLAKQTFAS